MGEGASPAGDHLLRVDDFAPIVIQISFVRRSVIGRPRRTRTHLVRLLILEQGLDKERVPVPIERRLRHLGTAEYLDGKHEVREFRSSSELGWGPGEREQSVEVVGRLLIAPALLQPAFISVNGCLQCAKRLVIFRLLQHVVKIDAPHVHRVKVIVILRLAHRPSGVEGGRRATGC
eukprot:scaffold71649_cov60-Phaeocystis_antarctica.AAC.2